MKKLTILCGKLLYPSLIVSKLVLGLKKARSFQKIGKWWLETILGQIWRLWRLAHPWAPLGAGHSPREIDHKKWPIPPHIQEELILFLFNSTNDVSIDDISQHRQHPWWCAFLKLVYFLALRTRNLACFVAKLRLFWCTFTGLKNPEVYQYWQISGMDVSLIFSNRTNKKHFFRWWRTDACKD